MKRLLNWLAALVVVVVTASLRAESTGNESQGTPMPMEDLTELRAFLNMLEPDRVWPYLKDTSLQFGMDCSGVTLDKWSCKDESGQTYSREFEATDSSLYTLDDMPKLSSYVWDKQGHLLTHSVSRYTRKSKYNLQPFSHLKWLSIAGSKVEIVESVPESVEVVEMSVQDNGIPYEFFTELPNMKVLIISNFNVAGVIDIERFPVLDGLKYLDIDDASQLRNFESILDKFPNLKVLELDRLRVSGSSLSILGDLGQLEVLNINDGVYGPSWEGYTDFLKELPELRQLSMYGFGRIDPSIFSYTPKLERLSFNSSKPDLASLPHLSNLKFLDVDNIQSLDGIERFPSLEALDLSYQTVDLTPLKNLPNLYWLNLSNGGYQNLDGLEGVEGLRYLNLEENPLESIDVVTQMPNLEVLKLAGFDANNRALTQLPDLTGMNKLRILEIKSMPLDEISPLPNPSNLEVFSFSVPGRRLTDLSPLPIKITSFTPSPNLKTFYCDLCLEHEINKETKKLIDQNLRESYSDERESKREHFQYRSALYKALKAKWEEGVSESQ